MAKSVVVTKPRVFRARAFADRITNYKGRKGDSVTFDLDSFGIKPEEWQRANIGFGDCRAAMEEGEARPEAFLYQVITGELYFNENSTKPGLGKGGGLICVFEGAPNLGALRFSF